MADWDTLIEQSLEGEILAVNLKMSLLIVSKIHNYWAKYEGKLVKNKRIARKKNRWNKNQWSLVVLD